jgi:DNA-binding NtrC family response regulator
VPWQTAKNIFPFSAPELMFQMKILIVEDDNRIAKPLAKDLRYQHHIVDLANNKPLA